MASQIGLPLLRTPLRPVARTTPTSAVPTIPTVPTISTIPQSPRQVGETALDYTITSMFYYKNELESLAHRGAYNLLNILRLFQLNVITIESLTAGMIATTLADIAGYGSYLYGGHIVYDTDAKRVFIGVDTPNVYSHETAQQMARKGLSESRAMISIAVTGNARTFDKPDFEQAIGRVWIGVAIRGKAGIIVESREIELCHAYPNLTPVCNRFIQYLKADLGNDEIISNVINCLSGQTCNIFDDKRKGKHQASMEITYIVSTLIRTAVVLKACEFAIATLINYMSKIMPEQREKYFPPYNNYDCDHGICATSFDSGIMYEMLMNHYNDKVFIKKQLGDIDRIFIKERIFGNVSRHLNDTDPQYRNCDEPSWIIIENMSNEDQKAIKKIPISMTKTILPSNECQAKKIYALKKNALDMV